MIKIVIGSMVICHLLVPNKEQPPQNTENAPIVKVLGEVLDITKGNKYIEQVEKKTAIELDTDMLLVKAKNKEGSIYQIDSRACMAVRKETEEERINRVDPPKKKVIVEEKNEASEDNVEKSNIEDTKKIAPIKEIENIEKQDLPAVDAEQKKAEKIIIEDNAQKKQEEKQVEIKPEPVKKQESKKEESKSEASKKDEPKKEDKKLQKGLLDYLVE